jgi:hypothetical protein
MNNYGFLGLKMTRILTLILSSWSLFLFYLCPQFIQGGDTAELVSSSYHLYVPHPPGYPLFLWLQHFWTHIFELKSVFWRAAILNSLFGIGALYFLILPQKKSILGIIFILIFATQSEFVEACVLPDVFALHALIVASFCWAFFFHDHVSRFVILPVLFSLGVANHHTIIFLLPCLFYVFWEGNKIHKRLFYAGVGCGVLISIFLYLSLFFLNSEHPFSWGNIQSISSLLSHILREDFGTFKLSASDQTLDGQAFLYLLTSLLPYGGIVFFLTHLISKQKKIDNRLKVFSLCLCFSLIFPLFMNVRPDFMGEEVLRRFHVMPLILVVTYSSYTLSVLDQSQKSKWIFTFFLLPGLFLNLYRLPDFFNLRNDSIIEDHSKNLLKVASGHKPVVIFADNDSSYFGLRYLLSFEPMEKVVVAAPSLFFLPWYIGKIKLQMPDFRLLGEDKIYSLKRMGLKEQVILPNLNNMNFLMMRDYKDGDWYKVTFKPIGRVIQKGNGIFFDYRPEIDFQRSNLPIGPQSSTKAYLYWQYSFFYLARAVDEEKKQNISAMKKNLLEAIKIVPFAKHAIQWLCEVKNQHESYDFCLPEKMNEILLNTKNLN